MSTRSISAIQSRFIYIYSTPSLVLLKMARVSPVTYGCRSQVKPDRVTTRVQIDLPFRTSPNPTRAGLPAEMASYATIGQQWTHAPRSHPQLLAESIEMLSSVLAHALATLPENTVRSFKGECMGSRAFRFWRDPPRNKFSACVMVSDIPNCWYA